MKTKEFTTQFKSQVKICAIQLATLKRQVSILDKRFEDGNDDNLEYLNALNDLSSAIKDFPKRMENFYIK